MLQGIRAEATASAVEVKESDARALEGEDYLGGVGETYLRQQIRHTNQLHYVRLGMLAFLLLLVILWLASIPTLLVVAGTRWRDFEVSDVVLVTYMGSTTISVLGLVRIAARWLFTGTLPSAAESVKEILYQTK